MTENRQEDAGLWVYRPVTDALERVPDDMARGGRYVFGASVRGKKHRMDGVNRDDCFSFWEGERAAVLAVCDGAGGKRFSRIGAKAAADCAVSVLAERLQSLCLQPDFLTDLERPMDDARFLQCAALLAEDARKAVRKAQEAVGAAWESRKDRQEYQTDLGRTLLLSDFATTITLVCVIPVLISKRQELFVLSLQIGDGMAGGVCGDGAVTLLARPDGGQYAGETAFLTDGGILTEEALMKRTFLTRKAFASFFVMSDGVADDYFPYEAGILRLARDLERTGVCTPVLEKGALPPEKRLRQWLSAYEKRGSFDDRTLLVLQWREETGTGLEQSRSGGSKK